MNEMVTDETLYKQCKNAANSIKPFLLDVIGQQWLDLMKINIGKQMTTLKKHTITRNSGRRRYGNLGFIQKDVLPFEFECIIFDVPSTAFRGDILILNKLKY
jgi:hypothetical protein